MTLQENGLLLQRRSSLFNELAHRNGAGGLLDPGEKWSNDISSNASQTVVTRRGLLTALAGLVLLAVCTWLLLPMGNDNTQQSSISTGLNLAMVSKCRKQVAKSIQRSACSSICSETKKIYPIQRHTKLALRDVNWVGIRRGIRGVNCLHVRNRLNVRMMSLRRVGTQFVKDLSL